MDKNTKIIVIDISKDSFDIWSEKLSLKKFENSEKGLKISIVVKAKILKPKLKALGKAEKSEFGTVYKQFKGKPKQEIKQLGFNIEDFIPIVVQFGEFRGVNQKTKRIYEGNNFRFIIQTKFKGKNRNWLLTAFDIIKKT